MNNELRVRFEIIVIHECALLCNPCLHLNLFIEVIWESLGVILLIIRRYGKAVTATKYLFVPDKRVVVTQTSEGVI